MDFFALGSSSSSDVDSSSAVAGAVEVPGDAAGVSGAGDAPGPAAVHDAGGMMPGMVPGGIII